MNEQDIFSAAIEIENRQQRAVFVEQACGNNLELRAQVNSLLKSYDQSGEFLKVPALEQANELNCPTISSDPATKFRGDTVANSGEKFAFLDPSSDPASIGRLGHYEIKQLIGRGGCGIVFKAFDQRLHRTVAIKVMSPELAATSPARKRFLREARSTATIRHGNVVNIYAVEEQPIPYLVMEYVDGQTLQQMLDGNGPLDISAICQIGIMIAHGLQAAHQQGIIHRDIKPGNILIESGTGRACITDFGLARTADDASQTISGGVIVGTPLYMSPEQARGIKLDQRSDLFSLGSVLYVMCCGRPPFRAGSTLAVLKRVADEDPRDIREIIPEIPDWLIQLIQQLHAKDPAGRPATARVVSETLAHPPEVASQPVHRTVPSPAKPTWLPYRPKLVTGVILLAGLLGLGTSEATGLTNLRGTVIRYLTPEGTLVIEVDDPGMSVSIDGEDMVITGAGMKELRMKPGQYQLQASKDGKVIQQELVTISRDGRQVVRVSREENAGDSPSLPVDAVPALAHSIWTGSDGIVLTFLEQLGETIHGRLTIGKAVNREFRATLKDRHIAWQANDVTAIAGGRGANNEGVFATDDQGDRIDFTFGFKGPGKDAPGMSGTFTVRRRKSSSLPADHQAFVSEVTKLALNEQASAVGKKLAEINPGFDGKVTETIDDGRVVSLLFKGDAIENIWPVRALPNLTKLQCVGTNLTFRKLSDLSPLVGLPLTTLDIGNSSVSDLSPLKGMPIETLYVSHTKITDLSPVSELPLQLLWLQSCPYVSDLSPLSGMQLESLCCDWTQVSDLSPLRGMPLSRLRVRSTRVSDLSPLRGIPLVELNCSSTQVKDLSPLEGAPLKQLYIDDTQISDLSPIRETPLETLKISEQLAVRNMQLLRAISTLKTINNEPASEFWEKHK